MAQEKKNLKGLTWSELQEFSESVGEPKYRGEQLFSWIYEKKAVFFEEMSDIPVSFRAILKNVASLESLSLLTQHVSPSDGTTKYLFQLPDDMMIESVLIPPESGSDREERRLTLCISTQVGCPLACAFCATGTMGFHRNLSPGEIIDQVLQVQRRTPKRISNIVFMGMGEPMLNYDNVTKAIDLLNDHRSLNIGARHMTLSTAGYPDKIKQFADDRRPVKLALSLHAADDEKRSALMPLNRKYPLATLIDALQYYYQKSRQRPTFEYILFKDLNDSDDDLRKLVALTRTVPSKVNLIPFHSITSAHPSGIGAALAPSPRLEEFARSLREEHVTVLIRRSAGEDIDAACGQLAVQEQPSRRGASSANRSPSQSTFTEIAS